MTAPTPTETIARFRVSDMTCGHCVGTVRQALERRLPGASISVDLASHVVETSGDAGAAAEAISAAGYTPEPI
jgi:copper chaperone